MMPNHEKKGDYYENLCLSNLRANFDSKVNGGKKSISCKTNAPKPCIQVRRTCLQFPIMKRMEILMRIQVCPILWTNFDSKENGGDKSFYCKTKASKPCIPMRRMRLWCPITKRVRIITRIQVCPIQGKNFDSKENGGKKIISCKTKALKSCIQSRKTCLQGLITKRKKIITRIQLPNFMDEL